MEQRKKRDFLIRNMPIEVYYLLEKNAKDHHRSMAQEAIVAISSGLSIYSNRVKQPIPFKWKKKISNKFIIDSIDEGRE